MAIDYGSNNVTTSGNVNISGVVTATSGNFTNLLINNTSFNSAVSGLLPTISNSGDNRVLTSTGSSVDINAESDLIFDGSKLGIGTSSPSYKLDVGGAIRSSGDIRIHGLINTTGNLLFTSSYADNATASIFCDRDSNWGGILRVQASRTAGGFGGQNGLVIQTLDDPTNYPNQNTHVSLNTMSNTANNSAVLYIGSGTTTANTRTSLYTERGAILAASSGNVGIGTATPSGKLHVIGTGIISSSLGIGTSSPSYPLHVVGSGYFPSGLVLGSSTTSGVITGLSNSGTIPAIIFNTISAVPVGQADTVFDFRKNNTRTHHIDGGGNLVANSSNGNFMAQSTSPSAGNGAFIGNGMRRYVGTNGFDFAWGENITSATEPGIDLFPIGGTHIASGILLRLSKNSTKSDVAMLVDGNGRVGIGTTSPSYQLHVIGTGNFSQNLLVNGTAVSLNGHTHNPSDITNLVANQGDNRILTSTGSSNNINAESNLNFDGTNLVITSGTAQRIIQGSTVSFSRADNVGSGIYDPIISGSLHISRFDNGGGIFNSAVEAIWNQSSSPADTEWNWDGWSNLYNFKTRTYTNFHNALQGSVASNIVGAELIVKHIPTQRYWKIKFSSWTSGANGGGFAYDRNELYLSDLIDKTNPTYTNGTLLIGSGISLVPNTLSAGSNISITNGSGTISIAATGLQSLLTNPITGTGTTNYISKFSSTSGLANSQIFDNGTGVGIGTASPSGKLQVIGNVNISGILTATSGSITTLNTVPTYLSPSALSTSQGDWNPGAGDIIRLSASTSGVNISGIVLGNEYTRVLINVGSSFNITLKHQASSVTAANRIITPIGGDYIIQPTGSATLLYDTVDSRWRIL